MENRMKMGIALLACTAMISCGEKSKPQVSAPSTAPMETVTDHHAYTALSEVKLHAAPSMTAPLVKCEMRTDDCGREACSSQFTIAPKGQLLQIEARTTRLETHFGKQGYWHRLSGCGAWAFGGLLEKQ